MVSHSLQHPHIQTHRRKVNTQAYTEWSALLCGRPTQQLVMMENTRHSHRHPTGRPCHCDAPGAADSPKAPRLQTRRRAIYSSAVQLSNNSNQTENQLILHSWFPNNRHTHTYTHTHTHTHTQASKEALAQSQIYARTQTHALSPAHVEAIILLLVKSLLYSLLFSQARESNLSTKEC